MEGVGELTDIADRYISRGGRTAGYGRSTWTADLMTLSGLLVWAEDDEASFGGHTANEAYRALCRLLDLDSIRLRKIMLTSSPG